MQALTAFLILFLLGAPLVDWTVAVILIRATWRSPVRALRERAILALTVAIGTTVFLFTVGNTELGRPLWDDNTGRIVVRVIMATLGTLPLYWLWLFMTRGFRDK